MNNAFQVFPPTFFNLLTGENRELMEVVLTLLYTKMSFHMSFIMPFEEACVVIEDILNELELDVDTEGEKVSGVHDKALYILRRLRACGWVEEEYGENYQRLLHFEDYAVEIMNTVRHLGSEETEEYSGYIYAIYQLLKSIDSVNGDLALEQAYVSTQNLFRQLASLNTNIKKYIKRLMNDDNKDDLKNLLEMLLEDYQTKVIDRAYYNLTTRDHPQKFRRAIIHLIEKTQEDEALMDAMTRMKMERKSVLYDEAFGVLNEQLEYIESSFESITELMDEIDRKNHRYITSAVARITFLLETHDDLEGKINRILKALLEGRIEADQMFRLFRTAYLDEDSLYTMRKRGLKVKQSTAEEIEIDNEAMEEFLAILAREQKFSRKNVEDHMINQLGERQEMNASEIECPDFESFTFLLLGYLYGHDSDSAYEINDLETKVTVNGYRFQDFVIRRV